MRLESGLSLHHSMSLFARGSLGGCTVLTVVNSPCLVSDVLCSSGPKDGGGSQPEGLKLFTGDVVLSLESCWAVPWGVWFYLQALILFTLRF